MKNIIKIWFVVLLSLTIPYKAQQTITFKNELKNNFEAQKSLYIGKSLNHILTKIPYPVKSYSASSFSGKTDNVTLYFVDNPQIRKSKPIALKIFFTHKKDINKMIRKNRYAWTSDEQAFFGNLIIKDFVVDGYP